MDGSPGCDARRMRWLKFFVITLLYVISSENATVFDKKFRKLKILLDFIWGWWYCWVQKTELRGWDCGSGEGMVVGCLSLRLPLAATEIKSRGICFVEADWLEETTL